MGKPLVLEEFGLARDYEPLHDILDPASPTTYRDRFLAAMLAEVSASAAAGGPLAGSNVWPWSGQARPGDPWVGDPPHEQPGWYSVYDVDAFTLAILADHAATLAQPSSEAKKAVPMNPLIPLPVSVEETGGTFTLTSDTPIVIDAGNDELTAIGAYLADWLGAAMGTALPVLIADNVQSTGAIRLTLVGADPALGDEGYELTVTLDGVTIRAGQPAGVFYGVQTLRQLLPASKVGNLLQVANFPTGVIRDYPRFAWRGMMLDVVRHFRPVEDVKRLMDLMALYKLNRLHLHLTDDQGWRLMIESWPRLAEVGGSTAVDGDPSGTYTQAEYAELVAYAASLVYNGERDGLGFRDSVQDILGAVAAIPDEARARLALMLTGQLANGGAMPIVKPFEHRPGHEQAPPADELRSDDCLWFFNAVPAYVAETGDFDFYSLVLPYADGGEDTVFGHLRRGLAFNLERKGRNHLPCGLAADWNDCLVLGYHGESLFVAFQLRLGLTVYAEIAGRLGKPEEARWALAHRQRLDATIQSVGWDGDWFIWAITEDGAVYGTKNYPEGQVYLNTQVWAVLSGAATPEQAERCMETVHERLATPYGLMLSAPPFVKSPVQVMRAVVFNPGIKENAGIFNHTQGWGVMAECLLGHGDRAWEYYRAAMPAAWNERAEIRQCEPYVQGQTTYSTYAPAPRQGNTRTSWLTGAAAWSYWSATQSILGLRPEVDGLRIDPCIPSSWPGFKAMRRFRGTIVEIEVRNPDGVCRGVRSMTLNGEPLADNLLPASRLAAHNRVEVVLG